MRAPRRAHTQQARAEVMVPKLGYILRKCNSPPQAPPEAPRRRRKFFGPFLLHFTLMTPKFFIKSVRSRKWKSPLAPIAGPAPYTRTRACIRRCWARISRLRCACLGLAWLRLRAANAEVPTRCLAIVENRLRVAVCSLFSVAAVSHTQGDAQMYGIPSIVARASTIASFDVVVTD